jgi:hypothetical protein
MSHARVKTERAADLRFFEPAARFCIRVILTYSGLIVRWSQSPTKRTSFHDDSTMDYTGCTHRLRRAACGGARGICGNHHHAPNGFGFRNVDYDDSHELRLRNHHHNRYNDASQRCESAAFRQGYAPDGWATLGRIWSYATTYGSIGRRRLRE